jgi:uncharacterized protein
MAFELNPVETRVLGCLIEKERLTPENYPLSLHSLTAACNQTTSRDPVVHWTEKTVETALWDLRQKKLATLVMVAGARVQKFRHHLLDHYQLDRGEVALLCVLLLRGPQTPGELRTRTDRLHTFGAVTDVESCLTRLIQDTHPLVALLPPRPGQKEKRYVQLLSGPPEVVEITPGEPAALATPPTPSRLESLEAEVATLKTQLSDLRQAFTDFKQQFE